MTREIFLEKNVPIPPIQWVYGTNGLQIAFEILDFDLTSVSSIKFYSQTQSGVRYEATGSKNGNLVSFKPISGFFAVGKNTLQCELVATPGTVYSFAVAVYCEQNNKFEGAEQDPVALANYIEQINKNTADISELKNKSDCATKEDLLELEERVKTLEDTPISPGIPESLLDDVNELKDRVDGIATISPNLLEVDKCLVNMSPNFVNNQTDIYDDGAVKETNKYVTTNVIRCNGGEIYTASRKGYQVNFYGAGEDGKYNTQFQLTMPSETFTIPTNVKYFRFRFTIPTSTDESWKNSFMIVKGAELPSGFTPYGETKLNPNLSIPKVTKISDAIYKDVTKGIFLITFDGLANGYDYVVEKMKENNLPFTLFTDTSDNSMIAKIRRDVDENMDVQLYSSQPANTFDGTSNYVEQYDQFKSAYDRYLKFGIGKPKFVAYSGGRHNIITEAITTNLGFKLARDTSGVETKFTIDTLVMKSAHMFTSNYTGVIPYALNLCKNWNSICTVITHGIDDSGADYHLTSAKFDEFVETCISYRQQGVTFMTFSQFFEYMTFPHGASKGDHILKPEGDGKDHEYVFDGSHWRELTM